MNDDYFNTTNTGPAKDRLISLEQLMTNVSINTAIGRMRYALINLRRMMEAQQTYPLLN